MDSRTASSSSMMCTIPLAGIVDVLTSHATEREIKRGAAARNRLDPDPAAMAFDDGSADRQADAHAGGFRGRERLEKLIGDFSRYPAAGVGDADHGGFRIDRARRYRSGNR